MDGKRRRKAKRQAKPTATPTDPPKPSAPPPDKPATAVPFGRPFKLTPELRDKIADSVRAGLPITFVGPRHGVSRSGLMKWLAKGRAGNDAACVDLLDAVKSAQSEFVEKSLGQIADHGVLSWQARAWLLERMFRDEFGGDKLELNILKKELRELRTLLVQVPRATGEAAAAGSASPEGSGECDPDGEAEAG